MPMPMPTRTPFNASLGGGGREDSSKFVLDPTVLLLIAKADNIDKEAVAMTATNWIEHVDGSYCLASCLGGSLFRMCCGWTGLRGVFGLPQGSSCSGVGM